MILRVIPTMPPYTQLVLKHIFIEIKIMTAWTYSYPILGIATWTAYVAQTPALQSASPEGRLLAANGLWQGKRQSLIDPSRVDQASYLETPFLGLDDSAEWPC